MSEPKQLPILFTTCLDLDEYGIPRMPIAKIPFADLVIKVQLSPTKSMLDFCEDKNPHVEQ